MRSSAILPGLVNLSDQSLGGKEGGRRWQELMGKCGQVAGQQGSRAAVRGPNVDA